jgi:hypothetical protein
MSRLKHKRASGGVVPKEDTPKSYTADSNVKKEAEERKDGGRVKKKKEGEKVEGKMTKMRLDRPGRKSGGRVGADSGPLSSAAKTDERPMTTKDCD